MDIAGLTSASEGQEDIALHLLGLGTDGADDDIDKGRLSALAIRGVLRNGFG